MPMNRRAFVLALSIVAGLAANACRRIVDLTPVVIDTPDAMFQDAHHGSDAPVDHDSGVPVGNDAGGFDPDGGVIHDAFVLDG
jgi:hypothetical protein